MVPPDEIHLRNQAALEELAQTLEWSVGEFHLFLARCSYVSVRSRLIKQLQGMCPISLLVVTLNPQTQSLYSTLEAAIATAQQAPDAIIVTGFEAVPNLKELLSAADASREEFRKSFSLPILLWLDDDQFQVLKNQAPNFESWAAVDIPRFEIATGEVLNSLRQGVGAVLAAAYAPDQRKISPAIRQISTLGDLRRAELPRALQTLRDRQVALPSDLEANLHLIQGIDAAEAAREMADTSHHETALTHLEGCIDYWHQDMEHAAAGVGFVSASPLSSAFDRAIAHFRTCIAHWRGRLLGDGGGAQGAVPSREDGVGQGMLCPNDEYAALPVALFYLGRHWFKHVDKARMAGDPEHSQSDWHQARIPLEECIALFDAADQEHMVAKVIRRLEGVLRRLEQWDALDALARRAIALHERYPTPDWLAIDHGFLAEAALGRQDWATAKAHAQQALGIIAALPEADQWGEGLYRSLVARAETGLGNPSEAIAQLETARDLGDRRHPTIYCDILAQLRSLYWERGEYLKAFKLKQARLEVEKVAGIRAFVGAGRLGAEAARLKASEDEVAPEIWASGRQRDLERIVARVASNDSKLTVIHGASGVGKSSLINAGVVPALEHRVMGTQRNRVVVLRRYGDWVKELEEQISRSFTPSSSPTPFGQAAPKPRGRTEASPLSKGGLRGVNQPASAITHILTTLRQWSAQDQRIILIFDQFEEFFFANPDPRSRRQFFEFLADCLQISFMNVIVSLREDYIHYLLDANRVAGMSAVGHDILGRNVLYRLGNFSPEDATGVIEDLTGRSRTYFEPALVAAAVGDLAGELGEVRPIELQVVGSQLETAGIGTLAQYGELGTEPKEALVTQYLTGVVADCGPGNEALAELVLFLLTDERGTRPLKTRSDLEREISAFPVGVRGGETAMDTLDDDLDLALRILGGSGIVMYLPEEPEARYQLVHDYIAETVRDRKAPQMEVLMARLQEEQEKRSVAEERERLAAAALLTAEERERLTAAELSEAREQNSKAKRRALVAAGGLMLSLLALTAAIPSALVAREGAKEANRQMVSAQEREQEAIDDSQQVQKDLQASRKRRQQADDAANAARTEVAEAKAELERLNQDNTASRAEIAAAQQRLATAQQNAQRAQQAQQQAERVAGVAEARAAGLEAQANDAQARLDQANVDIAAARDATQVERAATSLLRRYRNISGRSNFSHIDALLGAIKTGQDLKPLLPSLDATLAQYPALSPIYTLQQILHPSLYEPVKHTEKGVFSGHQGSVLSVSFSPDGSQIATASSDGTARLWSASGELVQEFSGHQGRVLSVSFSPDGSQIATASTDGTAQLWQVLGLDELMAFGCNWLGDYLRHSAEATDSDRALCNVESEGPTDEANSRATNSLQNIVRTLQRTLNIG